jgi:hypothetical protein
VPQSVVRDGGTFGSGETDPAWPAHRVLIVKDNVRGLSVMVEHLATDR